MVEGCGSFLEVLNSKIHHGSSAHPNDPGSACYGFYWGGSDSLFDHNEVYSNGEFGYHIYSWGSDKVSNNVVRNNIIYNNGLSGCNRGSGYGNIIISSGSNTKRPPAESWWVQKLSADLTAD
jgi:hypothetical protein